MTAEQIKLGIVGPGIFWHRAHKPILKTLPQYYRPVAFCSRTEERRESAAAEFPGARTFSNYEDLVRYPDIDAVLVLTPIHLNAQVAIAALKAGKEVYLEKPMGTSLDECDQIIELEKSTGKTVYVLEQMPYCDAWDELIEVLGSGEIGGPVMYDKASHFLMDSSDPKSYGATEWRVDPQFPLGTFFDGGVHAISLLATLFGPPESVYALGQSLREGYGGYDNISMLFRYRSGLQGMFSFSSCLGEGQNYFYIRCMKGLIELENRKFTIKPTTGKSREYKPKEWPEDSPHHQMWAKITESRLAGKAPFYTTKEARPDVATLLAVESSIKTSAKTSIEL